MLNKPWKANIFVVASRVADNQGHLVNDIELEQTNTVLFTSIFHHGRHKVKDCKEYLDSKRIPDRI